MAKTIIISADYFGTGIQMARQLDGTASEQMAHLLDCDIKMLHRYEAGLELLPKAVLRRVFRCAAKMDAVMEKE
ncbi:hypothetical protein HDR61_03190 [bacterium]|nr:hypothetical protein [bacterium]